MLWSYIPLCHVWLQSWTKPRRCAVVESLWVYIFVRQLERGDGPWSRKTKASGMYKKTCWVDRCLVCREFLLQKYFYAVAIYPSPHCINELVILKKPFSCVSVSLSLSRTHKHVRLHTQINKHSTSFELSMNDIKDTSSWWGMLQNHGQHDGGYTDKLKLSLFLKQYGSLDKQ